MRQRHHHKRTAFTLVEVLIVVVIMAVLAATIIPQFADSTRDARESTVRFNLNALRSQLELYKLQHNGLYPGANLDELTKSTDVDGNVGSGAGFDFGPYVRQIPVNPFNNSEIVAPPGAVPPVATVDGAGWLYDPNSGQIWINHEDYLDN